MNLNSVSRTVSLLGQLADTKRPTKPILPTAPQKPAFQPMAALQPLERVTPESQNVPSDRIRTFLQELAADKTIGTHQILILRNGKVIAQAGFGAQELDTWKYTFSACKSVTSLAIGILIGEGKLTCDTKVLSVFDKQVPPFARIKLAELTVRHLLTMTSGIIFNEAEAMTETDWVRCCLNSALYGEPGKVFRYNSLNTYLLSAIVHEITGQGLTEYLTPRLFEPMGIRNVFWEKCPRGIERGGWGLYLCPEDFAKLAQLVLQKGVWNGRPLVPAAYLEEATRTQAAAPKEYGAFDYGYQIWCGRDTDTFLFNGMFGQNALGFRRNGIVIATNAGNRDMFQTNAFFKLALNRFGEAFDRALPENPTAYRQLQGAIASFSQYHRTQLPHKGLFGSAYTLPQECAELDGVTLVTDDSHAPSTGLLPVMLQAIQNNYSAGLSGLNFRTSENAFYVEYRERDEVHRFSVGFFAPSVTELRFHGEPYRVAVCGAFAHDEDGHLVLKLRLDFLEMPCSRFLRLYMRGGTYLLRQTESPNERMILDNLWCFTNGLDSKPLIGSALSKIDTDYLTYRVEKLFHPELQLKRVTASPRKLPENALESGADV